MSKKKETGHVQGMIQIGLLMLLGALVGGREVQFALYLKMISQIFYGKQRKLQGITVIGD